MNRLQRILVMSTLLMLLAVISLQAEVSIVGRWTYKYCWGCGTNYSTTTIVFLANGNFRTGSSATIKGKWRMVGHEIIWEYTNGCTYAGRKIGSSVQGMMMYTPSNLKGCFYLIHRSTSTASLKKAFEQIQEAKDSNGIIRYLGPDGL